MQTPTRKQHRVLYMEADQSLRHPIAAYLQTYGFDVVQVDTITQARDLLHSHRFDVLLLDPGDGHGPGMLLIQDTASRGTPAVVVTSSLSDDTDRILSLEAGADHYLVKPFNNRALVAHLRAACRRGEFRPMPSGARVARFDHWSVDLLAHRASMDGRAVSFTGGELAILRGLLECPHRVLSRVELLSSTRQDDAEVFDRTVDVLISRLRHKLESNPIHPEFIQTIRGQGYIFTRDVFWIPSS